MDTFRKWLNKPKSDDKSLLARFYHADRSLTAVASELDSFDGRAEPDRCSRLVTRLRQGQDKVLAITNLIMEELLGDERDVRAFRAKFPEEVLQENLGGQLWFGAECLAAGSSIMNREQESKEMRPLAQAVTKSLVNVRSLLREQCLRSNVPNSKKLHLDVNDATTEQLYESLKIFDRLFAEFELRYVSAMVQVKTKEEYEMQEMICVLFSETLQRALKLELIEQDKVDAFDPGLMFSIPRLAIITGLVVYPKGPLNMDMPAEELSEMFRPFRTILTKIRDLLRTLTKDELFQLQKLLCTNEDIHMKIPIGSSSIEAPIVDQHNNNNSSNQSINKKDNNTRDFQNTEATEVAGNSQTEAKRKSYRYAARSPSVGSSVSADSSIQPSTPHSSRSSSRSRTASHSIASTSTAASDTYISIADDVNWSDDDDDDDDDDDIDESNDIPSVDAADTDELSSDAIDDDDDQGILTADCASGFLIPNTNFGNLLQPHEIPLTGNFVASDDEFVARLRALGLEEADMPTSARMQSDQEYETSQRLNRLRLSDSSEESERQTTPTENDCGISASNCSSSCADDLEPRESSSIHHHHHHHHHHHRHNNNYHHRHHHHHHQTERHHQCAKSYNTKAKKRHSLSENLKSDTSSSADASASKMEKRRSSEGVSTSSSLSDADTSNGVLRAHGRMKFKNTENLLHRLFVCIAGVADQLQTNFASDLRQILRSVFLMNMSIAKEDLDIPEKTRESELFEFRASETDVIQQESGGSNQSIYSAEEVNAELDNVFNNNNNNRNRHSAGATVQRENIIDPTMSGVQLARSRSVGDENASTADNEAVATTSRRLSNSATTHTQSQITNTSYIQRKNSLSNNSSTTTTSASASESNSPVSERASHNNTTSHQNNESLNRRMSPPAWIPDDKAPRCMSCRTPFTAFRRRHHCRNCGGVFCGVCSNASTPLPKYGLTKAVRVCRECYMREILSSASNSTQQYSCTGVRTMHTSANSSTTAGGL